jgi:hypothetical protein
MAALNGVIIRRSMVHLAVVVRVNHTDCSLLGLTQLASCCSVRILLGFCCDDAIVATAAAAVDILNAGFTSSNALFSFILGGGGGFRCAVEVAWDDGAEANGCCCGVCSLSGESESVRHDESVSCNRL